MVKITRSQAEQIAIWRLGILGRVLAERPEVVKPYLLELVNQQGWRHPVTGERVNLKLRTLQRWLKVASTSSNAMLALMPATRKDKGISTSLKEYHLDKVRTLYEEYPFWSWKLLHDNVAAAMRAESAASYIPSYSTLRRYLLLQQMRPLPRVCRRAQAGPNSMSEFS